MRERHVWWGIANLALSIAIIGAAIWTFLNRQELIDWWRLNGYTPPAGIVALADAATMEGKGRTVFYVSHPEVNDRSTFNKNCTDTGEESLVLGCYAMQRIYIYNVTDARFSGVKEVTAAHEMLHAAYDRLDDSEKQRVNKLLEAQLAKTKDDRLQGLINLYNKHEPGQLLNEMHSILGTEFRDLSPELEAYYTQYLKDRNKVVGLAEAYEGVFTASKERLALLDAQLADLKKQIDVNYTELDNRQREINAESARLNQLRNSDPDAYNQAVPGYNAMVRSYNATVNETRSLVSRYNALVVQRNNEVAAQNDLYHSLDSTYQTVPTN
ncbi:MAG: hypothetical protein ACREGJ_02175 [Candidatus Saccharimonadales bacterium]